MKERNFKPHKVNLWQLQCALEKYRENQKHKYQKLNIDTTDMDAIIKVVLNDIEHSRWDEMEDNIPTA